MYMICLRGYWSVLIGGVPVILHSQKIFNFSSRLRFHPLASTLSPWPSLTRRSRASTLARTPTPGSPWRHWKTPGGTSRRSSRNETVNWPRRLSDKKRMIRYFLYFSSHFIQVQRGSKFWTTTPVFRLWRYVQCSWPSFQVIWIPFLEEPGILIPSVKIKLNLPVCKTDMWSVSSRPWCKFQNVLTTEHRLEQFNNFLFCKTQKGLD